MGTNVLNIGDIRPECWGQLSSMFGTIFIYWIVTFLIINQIIIYKDIPINLINYSGCFEQLNLMFINEIHG